MSTSGQNGDPPLEGELWTVAEAARPRLRAEADQDADAARADANDLMHAASAAMAAGRSLARIPCRTARQGHD